MKSLAIGAVALTLISVGANALAASPASEAKLARGEYLVGITGCNDCHTPRGPTGEFVPGRTLAGAPLGFTPIMKMPWAPQARRISAIGQAQGRLPADATHVEHPHERGGRLRGGPLHLFLEKA
jgi:mono/diheme cytochrome c family protein